MTEVERLKVRAETLEEVANRIEANPNDLIRYMHGRTERERLAADISDQIRSLAYGEAFRARQLERRSQIAAQHVANQMAQI